MDRQEFIDVSGQPNQNCIFISMNKNTNEIKVDSWTSPLTAAKPL